MKHSPTFIYTGIHVSNLERSIRYYTKVLGMMLLFKTRIVETGGKVAWLKSKGSRQILELNWYPNGYRFGGNAGLDHLAFQVEDLERSYFEVARNHRVAIAPFLEGRWKLAFFRDPDGNWIELGQKIRKRKSKRHTL